MSLDRLRRIGVIGAGQMGAGIAHVCALAGFEVALTDVGEAALERGRETIDRNLSRQITRGKIRDADKAAALGRIRTGLDYALFGDCDMVIEAATEKEEIKREIFKKLVPALKPEALIDQHLVDLDYPAGLFDRSARQIHRYALYEPGAGDEPRRGDPRHRHG